MNDEEREIIHIQNQLLSGGSLRLEVRPDASATARVYVDAADPTSTSRVTATGRTMLEALQSVRKTLLDRAMVAHIRASNLVNTYSAQPFVVPE